LQARTCDRNNRIPSRGPAQRQQQSQPWQERLLAYIALRVNRISLKQLGRHADDSSCRRGKLSRFGGRATRVAFWWNYDRAGAQ
jgi:hypothetical protein